MNTKPFAGQSRATETSSGIALNWLLRLRWWVIACQILLVLTILLLFHVAIPLPVLALIISFAFGSNLYFHYLVRYKGGVGEQAIIVVMFLDVLLFTALLYVTGGPMNPFTFLYLVHISLGAILLRPAWALTLAGLASVAYAALFLLPAYAPSQDLGLVALDTVFAPCHVPGEELLFFGREVSPHLQGMWVAFAITAFFIVFFVGQAYKALERHRQAMQHMQEEQRKTEKLASLATLAAGAAHELATPLATIAVASGEMRHQLRHLDRQPAKEPAKDQSGGGELPTTELLEDVELIRGQVERCREILYQMGADAGEHLGEGTTVFPLRRVVEQALDSFSSGERERILVDNQLADLEVKIPLRTFSRILRGLLKNGLEASPPGWEIELSCREEGPFLVFSVRDQGEGMDQVTLQRAGEPFFTTKEVGKGMGLGLFLAKTAAEHFGGGLNFTSRRGQGTTVSLRLKKDRIKAK
ncbi:ATP-binding protein [Desulfurivibrio alkaliphilus]|uniref:histidine kinase n=1 Tax=Desulfurivibrio alkaliphilus (strain DSM 19089 / UNIQEM U267 / AHT2) TaxID=589865 RepID=D6Z3T7_DESAT|nr:ATP-binding protein [Desulfurivibrio alkaliphilus]ADH86212.1 integral membrane sensor signal transduction histidine kinase [Desulfurivibrio alkaliphilus AHT 2]